jgi:hypothetical protein
VIPIGAIVELIHKIECQVVRLTGESHHHRATAPTVKIKLAEDRSDKASHCTLEGVCGR